MAIVANKDGQGVKANGYNSLVDRPFETPFTAGSGVPSMASIFASQIYLDSATAKTYMALETGTSSWIETFEDG
jgi:hypothetical protein